MRKLFNNEKKFKRFVYILFLVAAVMFIATMLLDIIFAKKLEYKNYCAIFAQLPILIADFYFIAYQSLNKDYVSDSKYIHYLAIILMLNIAGSFTATGNYFSNIAFQSIQQLVTIAFMINGTFKKSAIGILLGLIVATLNFLQFSEIVWATNIVLAGICITKNLSISKSVLADMVTTVSGLLIIASILNALSLNQQLVHRYFYILVNVSSIFAVNYLQIVEEIKFDRRKNEINSIITKWVDKAYQQLTIDELLRTGVSALKGVSPSDAEVLKRTCNIETIADLASNQYFQLADELVEKSKRELF